MIWLEHDPKVALFLPQRAGFDEQWHVFEPESVLAINMALAARRPLLLRGEPGTGKSQLARAAAVKLKRAFVSKVIDSSTQTRELFWSVDSIERLAEAQVVGAAVSPADRAEQVSLRRFMTPGPLWWTYCWASAQELPRALEPVMPDDECSHENGVVLLIDEIDKADADIPNGLLEALGNGRFIPPDRRDAVTANSDPAPLVIITTNEERALPDAFVRRCLVHHLGLPTDREKLIEALVERGGVHFRGMTETIRRRAAGLLADDRVTIQDRGLVPPGQAEYLDVLRALHTQAPGNARRQKQILSGISKFAYKKHPPEPSR